MNLGEAVKTRCPRSLFQPDFFCFADIAVNFKFVDNFVKGFTIYWIWDLDFLDFLEFLDLDLDLDFT